MTVDLLKQMAKDSRGGGWAIESLRELNKQLTYMDQIRNSNLADMQILSKS